MEILFEFLFLSRIVYLLIKQRNSVIVFLEGDFSRFLHVDKILSDVNDFLSLQRESPYRIFFDKLDTSVQYIGILCLIACIARLQIVKLSLDMTIWENSMLTIEHHFYLVAAIDNRFSGWNKKVLR